MNILLFSEQAINGEVLFELSETDFRELEIKFGHRKKITKFINEFKSTVRLLYIL